MFLFLFFLHHKLNRLDELGGTKENQAIRFRMRYLISDTVLERYTWRGTGDKRAFEKLIYLNDLVFRSVRSNFKKFSYKEYKTYMVQWIKHAKTRQRTVTYSYPKQLEENDEASESENDENFE